MKEACLYNFPEYIYRKGKGSEKEMQEWETYNFVYQMGR